MKISYWELIGILFISGIGVFLHFAYELANSSQYVALLALVNERLWEHLKMAFYGMIGYALVEYIFIGNKHNNFIFAKAFSTLVACFLVVVLYYGYTHFLDPKVYLDIILFVVAILIAQLFSYAIIKLKLYMKGLNYIGLIVLVCGALLFASYTYQPPTSGDLFHQQLTHHKK